MIELTDQNFEEEIQNANKPVLVDFFAPWCQPCFIFTPILEKLAQEFEGKFILTKVNLDSLPLTAQKFGVDRIPTVILFKRGKPVSGFSGVRPESLVKEWLENMLKENSPAGEENPSTGEEKLIREYEDYAKKNGFQLNPNKEVVKRLIKGLLENEKKYGQRYCPCRRITGNKEEDKPKICPCAYHLEEIEKDGHCFCRLFQK